MEDRDNQQEIVAETEKAWLAGFLEGDGFITIGTDTAYKKIKDNGRVLKAQIGFCNTDALLIEKTKSICSRIANGGCWIDESKNGSNFTKIRQPLMTMRISRLSGIKRILDAVIPYMAGQKVARARLILEFVERRMSHPSQAYNMEEIGIVKTFVFEEIQRKGPPRGKALIKFLNDYTCDVPRPRNDKGQYSSPYASSA
jgi:hypothetical protein